MGFADYGYRFWVVHFRFLVGHSVVQFSPQGNQQRMGKLLFLLDPYSAWQIVSSMPVISYDKNTFSIPYTQLGVLADRLLVFNYLDVPSLPSGMEGNLNAPCAFVLTLGRTPDSEAATRMAAAHDFILRFPAGYETYVGTAPRLSRRVVCRFAPHRQIQGRGSR